MNTGTKLGFLALVVAVTCMATWGYHIRHVDIPENRALFVAGFLAAVALGLMWDAIVGGHSHGSLTPTPIAFAAAVLSIVVVPLLGLVDQLLGLLANIVSTLLDVEPGQEIVDLGRVGLGGTQLLPQLAAQALQFLTAPTGSLEELALDLDELLSLLATLGSDYGEDIRSTRVVDHVVVEHDTDFDELLADPEYKKLFF